MSDSTPTVNPAQRRADLLERLRASRRRDSELSQRIQELRQTLRQTPSDADARSEHNSLMRQRIAESRNQGQITGELDALFAGEAWWLTEDLD